VTDRLAAGAIRIVAVGVTVVFGWLLWDVLAGGVAVLSWEYLTDPVLGAGRRGGIGPILVSTGWILAVCLSVAVPIGLGTAVFLAEFTARSPFGALVRRSLDLLAGVPSIVFGLVGNALFGRVLGLGFSILSGGLTLALMVLPILIRITESGLRSVPDEIRMAAAASALTRRTTLSRLILPRAAPALVAGLVLGIGRALAETAALLYTSGYVTRWPTSLLDSGRTLSIHIYDLAMNVPGAEPRAYAAAVVLLAVLLFTNLAAARLTYGFARWQGARG